MSSSGGFHDLLFEMSNEYRYGILLILRDQAKRITEITREMGITLTEVRRHVARLSEAGLIQRDAEGYYHLSEIGKIILIEIQEFDFVTRNKAYLNSHTLKDLPTEFIKRLGDLNEGRYVGNVVDFIRQTDGIITEAREYVWLLVDQLPMHNLSSILEAVERGVEFRIIEPSERVLNPDIDSLTSEETRALARTRQTPLTEQRMRDEVNVFLYASERKCALSFPTFEGVFDYNGFVATDEMALGFCRDVFNHFWRKAELRIPSAPRGVERGPVAVAKDLGQVIVVGREDPDVDAQAVQDAVDNYDEVILKGTFNFGSLSVQLSRSVVVRGEGRENDVPETIVYKKGWKYPFTEWDCVLKIDGEGADVTIENIHFTDFNHTCIWGVRCNSLKIKNNRITLMTGYGRGMSFGAFGDAVMGINVWPELGIFKGRVAIEGNYLDFARRGAFGGFLTRGGLEEDPEYRPDLFNHEYYMGFGIAIQQASGNVSIENNIIKNANARGIAVTGCLPSADVCIRRNTVVSDVYGSYPLSSPEAGAGILAQSAWGFPSPGFNVEIEENTIKLDRLNYSGIIALGPVMDREGVDKLRGGTIRKNRIRLKEGYEGIHVRKCDDFEVADNEISGRAYYGIRISGRRSSGELDLRSLSNRVGGNDMGELRIREPDEYGNNHIDGRMFTGSEGRSATAHVWLNAHSRGNVIKVKADETVIDEGEGNTVEHVENQP